MEPPCTHSERSAGCTLLAELAIEETNPNHFGGWVRGGRMSPNRAFGGHIAAQSLLAAGCTVPADRSPNSLHMTFVSAGRTTDRFEYIVTELREGRSFSSRQVVASQSGVTRAVMLASFHISEPSASRQHCTAVPAPPPDLDFSRTGEREAYHYGAMTAGLDYQPADELVEGMPVRRSWFRVEHDIGDSPLWHAAMLVFASDIGMSRVVDLPYAADIRRRTSASLDHAMWFHDIGRADAWTWYRQESHIYTDSRGVCRGEMFDVQGALMASVAQEVTVRRRD